MSLTDTIRAAAQELIAVADKVDGAVKGFEAEVAKLEKDKTDLMTVAQAVAEKQKKLDEASKSPAK